MLPAACNRVASWRRGTSNCRDAFRPVQRFPSVSRYPVRRFARPRHWPVAGHGAEHDRHDRRRAVRHHPSHHLDHARAAGDARVDPRRTAVRVRRPGLGGTWRGDAAGGRPGPVSARDVRPTGRRLARIPVRLPVDVQRTAVDGVRCHRLRAIHGISLAGAAQHDRVAAFRAADSRSSATPPWTSR